MKAGRALPLLLLGTMAPGGPVLGDPEPVELGERPAEEKGKAPPPTYLGSVKAILDANCTVCHAARKAKDIATSGGLALDSLDAMLQAGVVVPGSAGRSEIVSRLRDEDPEVRMPRESPPLPPETIVLIEKWIDAGALPGQAPGAAEGGAARGEAAGTPVAEARLRPRSPLDLRIPTKLQLPKELARAPRDLPRSDLELRLRVAPLPAVSGVAFATSGEGERLHDVLAAAGHGTVTLWDLSRGEASRVLPVVEGTVHAVRFSPDGKRFAAGGGRPGEAGVIVVLETTGWEPVHRFTGHSESVYDLAFSPDGRLLASVSHDKTARVWKIDTGEEALAIKEHSDSVHGVAFLDGGKVLATAGSDRAVKLTDIASGKVVRSLSGHDQPILALAADPAGKALVSAGHEPALRFWNLSDGKTSRTSGGHSGRVEEIAFSRDGKSIASVGSDRTVRIWNAENGGQTKSLAGATEWLYSVDFDAGGRRVAAGAWDGTLRVWDIASGRLLATLISLPARSPADLEWAAAAPTGWFRASEGIWRVSRLGGAGKGPPSPEAPMDLIRQHIDDPGALGMALAGEPEASPTIPREREF